MTYNKYLLRVQYQDGSVTLTRKSSAHMTYAEACAWFAAYTKGISLNELGINYVMLVGESDGMGYPLRSVEVSHA